MAVVTNYYECSDLNQHRFIVLLQEYCWAQVEILKEPLSSKGSENLFLCLVQLLVMAYWLPWLASHSPSLKPAEIESLSLPLSLISVITSFLTLTFLLSPYMDLCGYTGLTWIIQYILPISRFLV